MKGADLYEEVQEDILNEKKAIVKEVLKEQEEKVQGLVSELAEAREKQAEMFSMGLDELIGKYRRSISTRTR